MSHGLRPAARRTRPGPFGPARLAAGGAAVAALVTGNACGPCDGVVGCQGGTRVGVGGQVVERDAGGVPARGVRVEFIRRDGVGLDAPTATATTDANGWWQMSIGAAAPGFVYGDVVVTPRGDDPPYRLSGVSLEATQVRGAGNVFGRWVTRPFISTIGVLVDSATNQPVVGARVTAVRRGGIEVEPSVHTRSPMVTSEIGYFFYDVRPLGYGPLTVDFVVERDGRPATTIRNATIVPEHEWGPPRVNGSLIFRIR